MPSSPPLNEPLIDQLAQSVAGLSGRPVLEVRPLGNGGNSRVFEAVFEDQSTVAVKVYLRDDRDRRDRLGAEWAAFSILWNHQLRCVPEPLARDEDAGIALYERIDGGPIKSNEVGESDIDRAVEFLAQLNGLADKEEANRFPPASEACFSAKAIGESLFTRLTRLQNVATAEIETDRFRDFLDNRLEPAINRLLAWAESQLGGSEAFASEISQSQRTLSPSDFGFHNALRRRDGEIAYLDFEYFGWDDPAKTVVDFVLHPAMDLRISLRRRYASSLIERLSHDAGLRRRVVAYYPLFGMKWCLILLNEFLPHALRRRRFADGGASDVRAAQTRQLAKSDALLERVLSEYENFPFL